MLETYQTMLSLPREIIKPVETYPTILSLVTGVPEFRNSQAEIYEFLRPTYKKTRHASDIFLHSGVDFRYSAVDASFYAQPQSTKARNEAYMRLAVPFGETVVSRALKAAGIGPEAIDDLFVVSCTGFDIPGLDLHMAGRLHMRTDLQRTCILGMGCYAAFPGLLRARQAVQGRPGRTALVLALELCSLHIQPNDSIEGLICASLFADGAAAVVIRAEQPGMENRRVQDPRPRLVDSATHCDYQTFEHMAFHVGDTGFEMRLSAYVPQVLAANVEPFVDGLLSRNHLDRKMVRFWGIHPGGRKILDYLQKRLGLADTDLDYSRRVLSQFGNMSSPTVLFVLDDIQQQGKPQPGDYGVLMAFGPGLTMESALVQW